MSRYLEMKGKKYGRWTVLDVERVGQYYRLKVQCDCGTVKEGIRADSVWNGDSMSCGCLQRELVSERAKTHGMSGHPEWQRYYDIKRRCYDPDRDDYQHYGGRGIKMCNSWLEPDGQGFLNYLKDIESFEGEGGEIDRIDVNGDYCPENCKWATRKEQTRNTRFSHMIEYKGESKCMAEWSEDLGIPYRIVQDRLGKLQWSVEKAFTYPFKVKRIVLSRESEKFVTSDVFKAPISHYRKASKLGISFHQYVATLFESDFMVTIDVAQESVGVESAGIDMGEVNLNLTLEFEQYCRENGLTIGGRLV